MCWTCLVLLYLICLIHGSYGDDYLNIEVATNGTTKLYITSTEIYYNVGDIVNIRCSVTANLLQHEPCTMFWAKDGGDEFYHLDANMKSDQTGINYLWTLEFADDGVELKCGARNSVETYAISVTAHRNKSREELEKNKPNLFMIILIAVGGMVAGSIVLLFIYQMIKCCIKKPKDGSIGGIPTQQPDSVAYAVVDLQAENNKALIRTDDPGYASVETGAVNMIYESDENDSPNNDSDRSKIISARTLQDMHTPRQANRGRKGRDVIILENTESASVC